MFVTSGRELQTNGTYGVSLHHTNDILKCAVARMSSSAFCCSTGSISLITVNDSGRSPTENSFLQIAPQERKFKGPTGKKREFWKEDPTSIQPHIWLSNFPIHTILPRQVTSLKAIFFSVNYQLHLPQIQIMLNTIWEEKAYFSEATETIKF